jgi:hypothetical protein
LRNGFKELVTQRGPTTVPQILLFPVISPICVVAARVWKRRHLDTDLSRA